MSKKASKSVNTNPNAPKITDFFKRATVSRDTNTTAIASPPTQRLPVESDHHLPEANATKNQESTTVSTNTSFSDASIPSSSMPGPEKQVRVIPSSDGEDESDSDGLEDPYKMLRKLGRKSSTSNPAPAVKKKNPHPHSPTHATEMPAVPPIPEATKAPVYKFSLDNLVAQKTKSKALDAGILRSAALFEEANKEFTDGNGRRSDKPISEGMLEEALGHGTAKRLLAALTRKDAWRVEKSWHFFDLNKDHKKLRKNPFPKHALGSGWEAGLATVRGRQQMFLSGFVQDMAKIDSVPPEEVLVWILDERIVSLETREDLVYAYFHVLCALPAPIIEKLVTESRVTRLFALLGAKDDALDVEKQIVLVNAERIDDLEGNFYNTKLLTKFFREIAKIISSNPAAIKMTCALLVRLTLDVRVAKQAEVRASVEDALAEIFESVPDENWQEISQTIALNLISTISEATHRLRALNALPVHTPRTHLFRRRLALSYLWDDPSYLTNPYPALVQMSRFTQVLTKPQFEINKNTDYADLQSHISIMDIAVDSGPTSGNVRENDAEVDVLVELLRNMFSGIYDTNAHNLARTEAKDTIERLAFRLRYSVRVKDKTNLVVETDKGPEWVGRDGKVQSRLPWGGKGGCVNGAPVEMTE